MMKRFLCGALATALVVGSVVTAPNTASAAKKKTVTLPKASKVFNMNKADKNVVKAERKGTAKDGGVMPTAGGKLAVSKGGKNGKGLHIKGGAGAQLKGVKVGSSWTVSFWYKPDGYTDQKTMKKRAIADFSAMFFAGTSLKDKDARWMSITSRSDLDAGGAPLIWSRDATKNQFPWYCKNGANEEGEAVWEYGKALDSIGKWVHVTVSVNGKKKGVYGEKGTDDYTEGALVYTYVNGQPYGNGTIAKGAVNGSTKFFLGINGWDAIAAGWYDDVTFWSKALSDKEAAALYKNKGIASTSKAIKVKNVKVG